MLYSGWNNSISDNLKKKNFKKSEVKLSNFCYILLSQEIILYSYTKFLFLLLYNIILLFWLLKGSKHDVNFPLHFIAGFRLQFCKTPHHFSSPLSTWEFLSDQKPERFSKRTERYLAMERCRKKYTNHTQYCIRANRWRVYNGKRKYMHFINILIPFPLEGSINASIFHFASQWFS